MEILSVGTEVRTIFFVDLPPFFFAYFRNSEMALVISLCLYISLL